MPNGIIVIDKSPDWTSMDVCAKLRGIFKEKRIGHAGTLDPMATGVLPVFVGRATRAVEFAAEGEKEYVAGLRLGLVTDTQDTTGQTLAQHPFQGTMRDVQSALAHFQGELQQIPPMFSAIKINGKKLYELARKGREVARAPRSVTIHSLTLEHLDRNGDYILRIRCSKGTYIRTLCHDIGQALGCGGAMSSLRRTMAAGFLLDNALTLEQVQQSSDPCSLLLPVDSYFSSRPSLPLLPEQERKLRNGMALNMPAAANGEYRVYGRNNAFLALGSVRAGRLITIKSFFDV